MTIKANPIHLFLPSAHFSAGNFYFSDPHFWPAPQYPALGEAKPFSTTFLKTCLFTQEEALSCIFSSLFCVVLLPSISCPGHYAPIALFTAVKKSIIFSQVCPDFPLLYGYFHQLSM
jgi:hypothetical protein